MFWRFRVNFLFFLFCEYIYRYWALENLSLSLQNSSRSGFLSFLSQLLGKNNRNKITTLRKVRFFLVSFKLRHLHIEKDSVTCLIWSTFRWQLKYTTHRYEKQTLVIWWSPTFPARPLCFLCVRCVFRVFPCVSCAFCQAWSHVNSTQCVPPWTFPFSPYVPRAYTAGPPKRLLVWYTIPSLFISAYVPPCVCVSSLAKFAWLRTFSHGYYPCFPYFSLWAQRNHHINQVHSIKETRTRAEKNLKGNLDN